MDPSAAKLAATCDKIRKRHRNQYSVLSNTRLVSVSDNFNYFSFDERPNKNRIIIVDLVGLVLSTSILLTKNHSILHAIA